MGLNELFGISWLFPWCHTWSRKDVIKGGSLKAGTHIKFLFLDGIFWRATEKTFVSKLLITAHLFPAPMNMTAKPLLLRDSIPLAIRLLTTRRYQTFDVNKPSLWAAVATTQGGLGRTKKIKNKKYPHVGVMWIHSKQTRSAVRLLRREDAQRCETPSPSRHRRVSPQNREGTWQLWFSLLVDSTAADGSPTLKLWWQSLPFYLRGDIGASRCLTSAARWERFC